MLYKENLTFDKKDFTSTHFPKGEYEDCQFNQCDFSNADLTGCKFSNCEFSSCNLSMAPLRAAAFSDCVFRDSKMLAMRFDQCNPFGFSVQFTNCVLNHSSFFSRNLKLNVFLNCQLKEVDFTEADLRGAKFDNCDLTGAIFNRSNLEKADLRTAHNYAIDPENNRLKKAKFSFSGIRGLLFKYGIEVE